MSRVVTARGTTFQALVVGAIVALVPWFSQPGRIVADTKLDLSVDPWGYLARAGTAWDSHAFFGQLQNQAYGYLFPMGPFFGVGDSIGLPAWVVQRAWWSVVLVVAFAGTYRLVRRWGIGGPSAAIVAGVLYALSPRALTVLGPISIEQWPSAMAPWIVLASMHLVASRGRARIGAFGVLALACASVGGVNATASLAAFAVAGLFMVTGRAERRVFPLWCLAVLVGTAWWAVPLVVLGRYAYPFLDFIETAAITTSVTAVPNVLRGASHWVGYVANGQSGGEWPAGGLLAYDRTLVVATTVVAVVAVLAIAHRSAWPGRSRVQRFALVALLVGVVGLGAGFGAGLGLPFTGLFATQVRELLDGPLAALRNVHKLDPVVRLPVCLGAAAATTWVLEHVRTPVQRRGALLALGLAASVAISPAVGSSLAPRSSYEAIPERWTSAAAEVDRLADRDGGSTLVAPATRFGEFLWGNTQGDPLEALTDSPVVKRDAIPLGNPGAIRVIDALDGTLRSGAARPGLVDLLDRLGIARVLVSYDDLQDGIDRTLDPTALSVDDRVASTLERSGLQLVEEWGEDDDRVALWTTGRVVPQADVLDAGGLTGLTGGPEAMVDLAAQGLLGEEAPGYVLDGGADVATTLQTDTLRRRTLDVAATTENMYSATLPADRLRRRDDFPPAETSPGTTRVYAGLRDVRATSSSADPGRLGYRSPAVGVASAFDGDDDTAWLSAANDDEPTLGFTPPEGVRIGNVTVQLADLVTAGAVREVRLTVDGTTTTREVLDQSETVVLPVGRAAERIEVALVPAETAPRFPVGIASLGVEGVDTAAELRLPTTDAATSGVVVSRDPWSSDTPTGRRDDSRVLDRVLTADAELPVERVLVRSRTTAQVERLVDGWDVSGPRVDRDLRSRPGAALDQDPSTRWNVGYESPDPTLTIDLGEQRTLTGLDLAKVAKDEPTVRKVLVRDLDSDEERVWTRAEQDFEPLHARRVALTFDLPTRVVFPVRMPDVTLIGAEDAPAADPASTVGVRCDDGATVQAGEAGRLGRSSARYTARFTRADLLAGAVVEGRRCTDDEPVVPAGDARLVGVSSQVLDVWSIAAGELPGGATTSAGSVESWSDSARDVRVDASSSDQVVVWNEGFNAGWRATLDGEALEPIEVDGWRQAFVVPAGSGGVLHAEFAPDGTYRAGLIGGGVLVLLAAVVALLWGRRPARWAPAPERSTPRSRLLGSALAVAALTLVGGLGGLAVGVLAHAVPVRWRWRALVGVGGALVVAVGLHRQVAADSWATSATQALGLALLALAVAVHAVEDGTLDEAPRQVGRGDGHDERGQRDRDERRLEQVVPEQGQQAEHDRQVPQEQRVGPGAEPGERGTGQDPTDR